MDEPFSEVAMTILEEAYRLQSFGNLEDGNAKLQAALAANILSPQERTRFEYYHNLWSRALDADYCPSLPDDDDNYPLLIRAKQCAKEKPHETTRLLWAYMQRCSFGTKDFHLALAIQIGYAAKHGEWALARHMAEIMMHHYAIARLVRYNPLLPTGEPLPATPPWTDNFFMLSFPYWQAIEALEIDPAPCWVRMLELTLEIALAEDQQKYFYPHVLQALQNHYQTVGDTGKLEWLKAYEPA